MNPDLEKVPSLPLEELELTPEWVKSPNRSYQEHSGTEPLGGRHGRDRDSDYEERERRFQKKDHDRRRDAERQRPRPANAPFAKVSALESSPPQRRTIQQRPFSKQPQRTQPPQQRPPATPVEVSFLAEDKALASIVDTIKQSARAYSFFDVAKLMLNKPERHHVKLAYKPAEDGSRKPLFIAMGSEGVFATQDEAIRFVFRKHSEKIFKETRTPLDPPKGNFLFVNRCGITGELLGPPNYHGYQSQIINHHRRRLSHVPFDKFQANIQTVRDPEIVKAWLDSMGSKVEYECLLDPEPTKFSSREELRKHVVAHHLDKVVASVPDVTLSGPASREIENYDLLDGVREAWVNERRFPLKTANLMQPRLRQEGLHFFKDTRGLTYVSAIKLKRFEAGQVLTENVQKIVDYLRQHPTCTRKEFAAKFSAEATNPVPDGNGQTEPTNGPAQPSSPSEQVIADLRWLLQDGYVVEVSNGRLWVPDAKQPKPVAPPTAAPASSSQPPSVTEMAPPATQTLQSPPESPSQTAAP